MSIIDWLIVFGFVTFLIVSVCYTRKYVKSVAGFLAAERCAGRYLLAVATGSPGLGAISILAIFEMYYEAGFTAKWWELMSLPAGLIIAMTGWVSYRYRQTCVLTLAELFERRYSRNFRIFAGLLGFLSGIINFGIFPAVCTRFFIYFCNIPPQFYFMGIQLSTYPFLMGGLLIIALFFTFIGGQVSIIIADFLQGIFFNFVGIALFLFLLLYFKWSDVSEVLLNASANAGSKINPFASGVKNFGAGYFLIMVIGMFYGVIGWQGAQGFSCSSKSAHEGKMAMVIGMFRGYAMLIVLTFAPVCVYVLMNHPSYAGLAESVNGFLAGIGGGSENEVRAQMIVPVALRMILPVGLVGAFCAAMFGGFICTHDTYLHSWGSIFIQDVIMPFRKKPFTQKQHMWALRLSITGVAMFIFIFSMVFRQTQYIFMFFAITGAIFLGGVGSVIIGGLYWKRGTTLAAYISLITGAVVAVAGIVITQIDPNFFLTGQEMFFVAIVSSIVVYIVVSLLGRENYDLDALLHREKGDVLEKKSWKNSVANIWSKFITKEFTRKDKILYAMTLVWMLFWTAIFTIGGVWHLVAGVPDHIWLKFWHVWLLAMFGMAIIIAFWLAIGGLKDVKEMYRILGQKKADESDDGWVEKKRG